MSLSLDMLAKRETPAVPSLLFSNSWLRQVIFLRPSGERGFRHALATGDSSDSFGAANKEHQW